MTELVGEAEGVASKVAVNVPVCEVITAFCQPPPEVAVTHAPEAVASVVEKRIDEKTAEGHARRPRNKRRRVIIGINCGLYLHAQPRGHRLYKWGLDRFQYLQVKENR